MRPDPAGARRASLPPETARVLTLLAVVTLTMMSGTVVAPALPGIAAYFADTPSAGLLSRLLLTIPALAIALASPGAGWLLDRFGRKRILQVAIAAYAVIGTAGLWLRSLEALVLSRALLGLTVAITTTAAVTLIGDYYSGATRNRLLGLFGAVSGLSGMLFLLIAGVLAEISWRTPFIMYASAVLMLVPVARILHEPVREAARAAPASDDDRAEKRRAYGRVFVLVAVLYLFGFCVQVAFYSVPVQLPFHLVALGVGAPRMAGAALAMTTLCAAAVAMMFARIRARLHRAPLAVLQLLVLGAGLLLVARARTYAEVLLAMVVVGAPMGVNFPNLMEWLLAESPPLLRGRVVGGLNMAVFMGQFLSPILLYPFVKRGGLGYAYRISGIALLAGAVVFALAVAAWRRRNRPGPANDSR